MLLSMSFYTSKAQNCIDFSGSYNLNNWKGNAVGPHSIENDIPHGNYLQLEDDDNLSYEANDIEFNGNWLTKAENGCLCFDYNVDWSAGNAATLPKKAPILSIYYNTGNIANILTGSRANFVGNSSNLDLQNNTWRNFCLPVGLSSGTNLPSNSYGTWLVYNGNTLLTGTAASTAWDNLIQNVTGIALFTDYNEFPGELVRFDNFCWTCAPPICNCSSFITFTESPYVITPDGGKLSAPSCERSLGSILNVYTPYQFAVGFQSYNTAGCTTEYSATITNSNNVVIASQISTNGVVPLSYTFSQSGDYSITYSLKVNGVVCTTCKMVFRVELEPNPCCNNLFGVKSEVVIPPSYPYKGGTYSIENFNVIIPNNIPITEIKVNVESFEIISAFKDCQKCENMPITLGSLMGIRTIGTVPNDVLTVAPQVAPQGYGSALNTNQNTNEIIWSNPNGVLLSTNDKIGIIYLLPSSKEIPCCALEAKVCIRISWRDTECNYCEVTSCSFPVLKNPNDLNPAFTLPWLQGLYLNAKGIFTTSYGKAEGF